MKIEMGLLIMNLDEFNYNVRMLEQAAYRVIRRMINDFESTTNNDEIAGFTQGVTALQTELYGELQREFNNGRNA